MKERLQKIIAAAGIASRRQAEALIRGGRVCVNNEVITELGAKADASKDEIRVDGKRISAEKTKYYIALHKPAGYVTTMRDPQGRSTVMDLIKGVPERIYPVGRLDYHSKGLLLLTNDGDFAQKVQHPRFEQPKAYRVKIQGHLSKEDLKRLSKGVALSDGVFKPENLKVEKINDQSCWLCLTIKEGRNREIRRGLGAIGHRVSSLIRYSIGNITLNGLKEGEWRHLTSAEIRRLTANIYRELKEKKS
jgi:pseudouridine synthase